jgi:hypothetical protein
VDAEEEEYVRFLEEKKEEPRAAELWWNDLIEAVSFLENLPERCPADSRNQLFAEHYNVICHSHRVTLPLQA